MMTLEQFRATKEWKSDLLDDEGQNTAHGYMYVGDFQIEWLECDSDCFELVLGNGCLYEPLADLEVLLYNHIKEFESDVLA